MPWSVRPGKKARNNPSETAYSDLQGVVGEPRVGDSKVAVLLAGRFQRPLIGVATIEAQRLPASPER